MYQKIKKTITFAVCLYVISSVGLQAAAVENEEIFFRYIDEQGVKVINQSIPPGAVVRGYEIISVGGQVLKVVAPAPKGSDIKRMEEQMRKDAELAVWDAKLNRRYSSVRDIESAKERSLSELRSNLTLLDVTLEGVVAKIKKKEKEIGIRERNARPIVPAMLQTLKDLASEKEAILAQMKLRKAEVKKISDTYDRDIERFRIIDK